MDSSVKTSAHAPQRAANGNALDHFGSMRSRAGTCAPYRLPVPIDNEGRILSDPFFGSSDFAIIRKLQSLIKAPVRIETEANAAALAEQRFGVCRGISDFIMIHGNSGIGSGLYLAWKASCRCCQMVFRDLSRKGEQISSASFSELLDCSAKNLLPVGTDNRAKLV